MSVTYPLRAFNTFARLRDAALADAPALNRLATTLRGDAVAPDSLEPWQRALVAKKSRAIVAMEGQLLVGAVLITHHAGAAVAILAWIGVQPSARSRGIGHLLLEAAMDSARSQGAAVLKCATPAPGSSLHHLLIAHGFARDHLGAGLAAELWDERRARAFGMIHLPERPPAPPAQSAAAALLTAMGALDRTLLLTQRAEKVLGFELRDQENTVAAMAASASRRGFSVYIDDAVLLPDNLPSSRADTVNVDPVLTPERLLGHLSRGHLGILHLHIPRLGHAHPAWFVVNGFDGYLFHGADATLPTDQARAITTSELRVALQTAGHGKGLVLGKVL